mmetsp:Transcript_4919/g.15365  ORF Transcript_4919/g.15365 Transcript_4919/m.15365 type:complete len:423 (-) Transcript_4919:125-1393(-)
MGGHKGGAARAATRGVDVVIDPRVVMVVPVRARRAAAHLVRLGLRLGRPHAAPVQLPAAVLRLAHAQAAGAAHVHAEGLGGLGAVRVHQNVRLRVDETAVAVGLERSEVLGQPSEAAGTIRYEEIRAVLPARRWNACGSWTCCRAQGCLRHSPALGGVNHSRHLGASNLLEGAGLHDTAADALPSGITQAADTFAIRARRADRARVSGQAAHALLARRALRAAGTRKSVDSVGARGARRSRRPARTSTVCAWARRSHLAVLSGRPRWPVLSKRTLRASQTLATFASRRPSRPRRPLIAIVSIGTRLAIIALGALRSLRSSRTLITDGSSRSSGTPFSLESLGSRVSHGTRGASRANLTGNNLNLDTLVVLCALFDLSKQDLFLGELLRNLLCNILHRTGLHIKKLLIIDLIQRIWIHCTSTP